MLKKLIFTVGIGFFATLTSYAQAKFEFLEDKHDFGTIIEGANALWEFKFKNVGTDTILLEAKDVRASCGCTTPNWSKEAILPGQMGSVSAQFGSAGRVGPFNKNVTVSYNGSVVKMLLIKGIVIKPDTVKYSEAEIKKAAKIELAKTEHNFGKVERGQSVSVKIDVKNAGKDSLTLNSYQAACSCITAKLLMEKRDKTTYEVKNIPQGKSGIIELIYLATADGLNTDIVTLYTSDKGSPRTSVALSAEVVSSLQQKSPLMEENTIAPFGK